MPPPSSVSRTQGSTTLQISSSRLMTTERCLSSPSAGGLVQGTSLPRSPLRTVPRLFRLSSIWFINMVLTELSLSKSKTSPEASPCHSCFLFLSWEFPNGLGIGCNQNSTSDAENFIAFLKNLRGQTSANGLLISAAVSIAPPAGSDGTPLTNVTDLANVLDHITIMNYDINVGPPTHNIPNRDPQLIIHFAGSMVQHSWPQRSPR